MHGRRTNWLAVLLLLTCVPAVAQDPDAPLHEARRLLLNSRFEEARTRIEQAQETWRLQGDRHREALGWLLTGLVQESGSRLLSARDAFARAARDLEAAGDPLGSAMSRCFLALLDSRQGRSTAAVDGARAALDLLRRASPEDVPAATVSVLAPLLGLPEASRPLLQRRVELLLRDCLAEALLTAGRLDEAEAELPRLAGLSRELGGVRDARVSLLAGGLRQLQGRLDESMRLFETALEQTIPTPEAPLRNRDHEIFILGALVETAITRERPAEALTWSRRALEVTERAGLLDDRATALQLHAQALHQSGRTAEAEAALHQALDWMRTTGNRARQAQMHLQLGQYAFLDRQPAKAALHLETSLSLYKAFEVPFQESLLWTILANTYALLGSFDSAGLAVENARKASRRSGSPVPEALLGMIEAMIGPMRRGLPPTRELKDGMAALLEHPEIRGVLPPEEVHKMLLVLDGAQTSTAPELSGSLAGQPGAARLVLGYPHFRRGDHRAGRIHWLAGLAESPRIELEIALRLLLALSFEAEGANRQALEHLTRAAALLEQTADAVPVEELLATYLDGLGPRLLFDHLVELLVREGRTAEAFEASERARARAFLLSLGGGRPGPDTGGGDLAKETDELRRQILKQEAALYAAPPGEEMRRAAELQAARQRYAALRVRLAASQAGRASTAQARPLPLAAVQRDLPEDATLISYYVTEARVHAWVIDRDHFHHAALPVSAVDLQRALCWAEQTGRSRGDLARGVTLTSPLCETGTATAEELYAKLIAPLRSHIRHPKLLLIPHGALHSLPFAALRDPQAGYLVEHHTLTLLPGASVLRLLRARETPVEGGVLVFGNPASSRPDLGNLSAAATEAELVAEAFATHPLLGGEATESRLYRLNGEVDLVYIAAHGIYEPATPLFSRIALAPDEHHDGNLEVHEILGGLDLAGVNLVVLSACQTAAGERSRGDEIIGLTRAFLDAGSPGVVSTLWQIHDTASAVLMADFYRHLREGAPAAEALRRAQLNLRAHPLYSEPYYWAAFTLTGDPQGRW